LCGWDPGGWMVTCQSSEQLVRHYLEVTYRTWQQSMSLKWIQSFLVYFPLNTVVNQSLMQRFLYCILNSLLRELSLCTGDVESKPSVTSEPDVASIELDGTEDYVVLACDGIWDVIRPSKIS